MNLILHILLNVIELNLFNAENVSPCDSNNSYFNVRNEKMVNNTQQRKSY